MSNVLRKTVHRDDDGDLGIEISVLPPGVKPMVRRGVNEALTTVSVEDFEEAEDADDMKATEQQKERCFHLAAFRRSHLPLTWLRRLALRQPLPKSILIRSSQTRSRSKTLKKKRRETVRKLQKNKKRKRQTRR